MEATGLPQSLHDCVLTLDDSAGGGHLHFLQPSSTVEVKGVVSSYQYRPIADNSAEIDVVPVGGSLGNGYCTVRHELELTAKPTSSAKEVTYRVQDTGVMEPCSTADGRILSPVVVMPRAEATLACPRGGARL